MKLRFNIFKIIKWFLLLSLIVVVILTILFLKSPWFWKTGLRHIFMQAYPFSTVTVQLDDIDIRFKKQSTLNGLKIKVEGSENLFAFDVETLTITPKINKDEEEIQIHLNMEGGNLIIDNIDCQFMSGEVTVKGKSTDNFDYQGYLQSERIILDKKIKALDFAAVFSGDSVQAHVETFRMEVFGGEVEGNIKMDYQDKMVYIINTNLKGLQASKLEELNKSVLSYVRGSIDGELLIEGDEDSITNLEARFSMPQDSSIKASLLRYLIEYIPENTVQRKALEAIIQMDGYITVDQFEVNTKNIGTKKLENDFKLKSNKYNLDVGVKLDMQFDQKMDQLLEFLQ